MGSKGKKSSKDDKQYVSALQVAKHAGVSRSAVSRAFTPGASVSAKKREKIMEAAEALGYQVNDLARGLLARKSRLVGLVVTNPELGYRSHLVAALTKALIQRGSVPIVINTGQTDDELVAAQKTLFGYRAEATIILSGSPPSSFVDLARRNGQPLIVLGRSETGADDVNIDNEGAGREAARQFLASGCRKLGFAGALSRTPTTVEREYGFQHEAELLGAAVKIGNGRNSNYAGGQEAAEQLFSGADHPDAVFCVNDLVAFGLIDYVRRHTKLRVPNDLSVIGFDDIPEAAWDAYNLTTFKQDASVMAAHAVALLDRRDAEPDHPPVHERLTTRLIERGSARLRTVIPS
ncbi:transcriptional regulator [Phyllobacterium brassicacearum]|uniref:Transcriptional regulator n=1 Tax=Phyllobacterium brassicacearum TaxID=314235 RepID=A0A2P7BEA9_9HYPH|nr:LacI family DNA-binding transcriptional regulator [Phyllobacterium brassicacearum]PSH64782.1 transcriptional regulator [Phyllobacterium brassicacearum]TDQ21762.1 LacI family transcriptional regulator [Phyllobacterium brassicacearum]